MEETATVFKAIKVTNPLYLGQIAGVTQEFSKRINVPSITYETLYTYFCNSVQYGGELAEFWVILNDKDEPTAFAHWAVRGLPHRGVVYCDFIYSWNRMSEPISLLLDKFIDFGIKHNCPLYEGTAINETVFRVFRKAASARDYELIKNEFVDFMGRKRKKENG